jgi:hypothetical protein
MASSTSIDVLNTAEASWLAGANPNGAILFIADRAMTVQRLVGIVVTAAGGTATVSVNKVSGGVSTVIHSSSFNANGTALALQTLTLTVTTLAQGDFLQLSTTGAFTASAANLTVYVTYPQSLSPSSTVQGFITSVVTPGTLRNNWPAPVGMQITVGASPITVTSLGRWMFSGNTQAHQLTLVDVNNVNLGSVTVNMAGKPVGQFVYATLSSPVVLSASHVYYVLSGENQGGDFWYDNDAVVATTADAHLDHSVYEDSTGGPVHSGQGSGFGQANHPYGPVDFQYSL